MGHELQGKIYKQLWLSPIHKKPSWACAYFHLYMLLFIEAYYKLKLPAFHRKNTYTFSAQLTICCKFSSVYGHVTKYCCYVMFDRISPVA